MQHRKDFALHKPEPAIKITQSDGNHPSFNVVINGLSLALFNTKAYENITGLTFQASPKSLNIKITPALNFKPCDAKFRSMMGKLNAENHGLSLNDLDKVISEFNVFLTRNKIHSAFTNPLRNSNERETPHTGFAH